MSIESVLSDMRNAARKRGEKRAQRHAESMRVQEAASELASMEETYVTLDRDLNSADLNEALLNAIEHSGCFPDVRSYVLMKLDECIKEARNSLARKLADVGARLEGKQ